MMGQKSSTARNAQPANMTIKLKYFDTAHVGSFCGRGGDIRFFLLLQGLQFTEDLVDWEAWETRVRTDVVKSGESPAGYLPIVTLDNEPLTETFAVVRRLAKRVGVYGHDEKRDYASDMVADATYMMREAWHNAGFGSEEDKHSYSTDKRKRFYGLLNTYVQRYKGAGPHVVGNEPTPADSSVFAYLWDDVTMFGEDAGLWEENPKLAEFYRAYLKQAPILKWCSSARPDLCSSVAQ
jgi:glutathione S-transferase